MVILLHKGEVRGLAGMEYKLKKTRSRMFSCARAPPSGRAAALRGLAGCLSLLGLDLDWGQSSGLNLSRFKEEGGIVKPGCKG